MENLLTLLPEGARVLIIRLRSLGDCVLVTPAIHLLKTHRPDLRIGVVVEDAFAPVFAGNPDLERILPPTLAAVSGYRAELCLNLHGGTRSLSLTAASRARFRAGFVHFRMSSAYNVRIPTAQQILGVERVVHTAEHVASAMFYLGVPQTEIPRARLFPSAPAPEIARPYAVIHPKASAADKTWPAENFRALAAYFEAQLALHAVFIAGPGENLDEFSSYERHVAAPLEQIKTLLSGATLFAGNDSGPAHMAAAFGVPSVVFFGSSNAAIWAPWRTPAVVLTAPGGIGAIDLAAARGAAESLSAVQA
jgi:ADP-heptose:LPS heptosyltransferase